MAESMRGVQAERTYNRRWLVGVLAGPLLMGVLAAVWMLALAGRLPAELATHWNGRNDVDGWMPLWGVAASTVALATCVGGGISALAVATRRQNLLLARIGVGFGLALAVAMTSLMLGVVAGQIDAADASQTQIYGPVMAGGLAAAFVIGALAVWRYRPGEVRKIPDAGIAAMNQALTAEGSAVTLAGRKRVARDEIMTVRISMGPWAAVLSLGIGAAVAAGMFFIYPLLALLGVVVGGLVWVFSRGTAVIGPDGAKVLAGGFWQVMPLAWADLRQASVEDIRALDYGGWGYRINGGSVGFIMGDGPALVLPAGFHHRFVISMPDMETAGHAAALANAYAASASVLLPPVRK